MWALLFLAAWPTEQLLEALGAPERERGLHLQALGNKVHAKEAPLERFCTDDGCALDRFFDKLAALARGEALTPVRIVHLGDSQIASDYITDVTRRRLSLRFGSGGRGFLFIDRPTPLVGRGTRAGSAGPGWQIAKIPAQADKGGIYGHTGVRFFTTGGSATTKYALGDTKRAELFYLATPKSGSVEVSVDDVRTGEVSLRADVQHGASEELPITTGKSLTLKTRGATQIYGVVMENGQPGVVYDAIGVPGSDFDYVLNTDAPVFIDQLQRRDPALVVLQLGGAEVYRLTRGWANADRVELRASELIARVKEAAPDADCLIFGPLSRGFAETGEARPQTVPVDAALRRAAQKAGCGYWSALEAMGGVQAAVQWYPRAMMNMDLVHPRGDGADLIGHLYELAIARAYAESGRPWPELDLGLHDTEAGALKQSFAKLDALEKDKQGRFAIVHLGASHTSAQMFSDEARKRLVARFGDAGRGFIDFAGGKWPWEKVHIGRKKSGHWIPFNALRTHFGLFGLTGSRFEGLAGASYAIDLCKGCPRPAGRGRTTLDLFYLDEQGSGPLEVSLDGKRVAEVVLEAAEPVVKRHTMELRGMEHAVQVKNAGENKLTLLGAAVERDTPGIVYDALGLPGSTAIVADGFDKTAFKAQLEARRADLYVLFYGTNESSIPHFSAEDYAAHYRSLLATLREASPGAECLILGNSDRLYKNADGKWIKAPAQDAVEGALRAVAASENCAFWSTISNMGGSGAADRWARLDEPLCKKDRVHMTRGGYEALARRFVDDLMQAYQQFKAER